MAERSPHIIEKDHDTIFELIPWYVNGSLPDADSQIIEHHSADCAECRDEIERQSGIAAGVCLLEPLKADAATKARSWEQLSARIAAEQRAQTPARDWKAWLPSFRGLTALASACAAILLVAIVFTGTNEPTDGEFQTLTSDSQTVSELIMFQIAPGTDAVALQNVLAEHGLTLVGEPSDNGVYRAMASAGADLAAKADALMATPEVLFAATEGKQ